MGVCTAVIWEITEPFIFVYIFARHWLLLKNGVKANAKLCLLFCAMLVIPLALWDDYRLFVTQSYIYASMHLGDLSTIYPEYTTYSKLEYLHRFVMKNKVFWVVALCSFFVVLSSIPRSKIYIVPTLFIVGSLLLVGLTYFPFVHYQLYLVYAVLFSLPFSLHALEKYYFNRGIVMVLILFLSIVNAIEYEPYKWALKSLKDYTNSIDGVKDAVGKNDVYSIGGSAVGINSPLPFCDCETQFMLDVKRCQSNGVGNSLSEHNTKYIFIDEREKIIERLSHESKYFIVSNYQQVEGLPLKVASKWGYTDGLHATLDTPIHGEYNISHFVSGQVPIFTKELIENDVYYFHQRSPAVHLLELDNDKIVTASNKQFNNANSIFYPEQVNFEGKIVFLGTLVNATDGSTNVKLFWKKLDEFHLDLAAFVHLFDENDIYIDGINFNDFKWLSTKGYPLGEVLSYSFNLPKNRNIKSLNLGWFDNANWSSRLNVGSSTYHSIYTEDW